MCRDSLDSRGRRRSRSLIAVTVGLILVTLAVSSWAQSPEPGSANGFELDGNLFSNVPGGTTGPGNDWLDGPSGPGTGVLHPDGIPKDPLVTFHFLDLIESADLDIFGKSTKVLGDPNSYTWKSGSVPQKDDIQNGLIHLSRDASGDHWLSLAGDRRAINGDSYIDFEFLQNLLVKNPNGTFSSAGPHGGRTLGDMLLTITLIKGGSQAEFSAREWTSDGVGGYTYADVPFPTGAAFVAANVDSQIALTYDAFDTHQYGVNQFGEAAVNLNAILPNFNECFGFATVFVRTKSSASTSADLKDFIEPFQLNLCLDEEPPQLTCPPDLTIPCNQSIDPGDIGFAFGSDNCSDDPPVTYVDSVVPGSCDGEYVIHRTWTVTDVCANTTSCTQVITVVDDTAPTILSAPGPMTVQCTDDLPPPDVGTIVAADDCGNVTVTHLGDVSDGRSCPEIVTRTYLIDDGCGNTIEHVQPITVHDTTPPDLSIPDDITVQCSEEVPTPNLELLAASDNCSPVTLSHVSDVSDGNTCPERITRTYRAIDDCGNVSESAQTITVGDTTLPEVAGPEDITVQCSDEIPPADTGLLSATDNCGGVTFAFVGDVSDGNTCPERITRTYRVADGCGNAADYVQIISVNDTTPPEISGPADITVECRGDVPPFDIGGVAATDNCGGAAVTHLADISDGNACPERITRTYRATDDCGNTAEYTQIITIHDRTNPDITCLDDITVQCVHDVPSPDVRLITATDACEGVGVTHVGDFSDGQSCPQTISRVYRATDDCGNTTECTQTIIVMDTIPPTITTGPEPIRVQCPGDVPPPTPALVGTYDNCSDVNVVHHGDESDGNVCPEVISRRYRAYDECFNFTDYVQLITVDDETPPTLTSCPQDETVECPDFLVFGQPTATDNCDPHPELLVVSEDSVLGTEPWTFTATRTWTAVDYCSNVSDECTQRVTFKCDVDALCTHTQGFYGNYGGKFNGIPTLELIQAALSQSSLIVGVYGSSSLTIPYESAHCVVERLPAGTTPTILPYVGDSKLWHKTCLAKPKEIPLNSDGRFENVFLGQVITLGLNMRLSSALFLFPLSEEFCTQPALPGPDGLYGTEDDMIDTTAPIGHYHIPSSVLAAISELDLWPTVKGLWDLANRGLAGGYTARATISEINDAVDAINRGFDGCRFIVDCTSPSKSGSPPDLHAGSEVGEELSSGSGANLPKTFHMSQNYPNPFNPSTRISLAVPEATAWTLSIYNVSGQLVRLFEGRTGGPAFVDVDWNGSDSHGRPVATGVYLYRIKAGSFADVKKMILLK